MPMVNLFQRRRRLTSSALSPTASTLGPELYLREEGKQAYKAAKENAALCQEPVKRWEAWRHLVEVDRKCERQLKLLKKTSDLLKQPAQAGLAWEERTRFLSSFCPLLEDRASRPKDGYAAFSDLRDAARKFGHAAGEAGKAAGHSSGAVGAYREAADRFSEAAAKFREADDALGDAATTGATASALQDAEEKLRDVVGQFREAGAKLPGVVGVLEKAKSKFGEMEDEIEKAESRRLDKEPTLDSGKKAQTSPATTLWNKANELQGPVGEFRQAVRGHRLAVRGYRSAAVELEEAIDIFREAAQQSRAAAREPGEAQSGEGEGNPDAPDTGTVLLEADEKFQDADHVLQQGRERLKLGEHRVDESEQQLEAASRDFEAEIECLDRAVMCFLKREMADLTCLWEKVREEVRKAKPGVFVTHSFLMVSEISRVEMASLFVGGLVALGWVSTTAFYRAAIGRSVMEYFTLNDLLYQGVRSLAVVAVGLITVELVFFAGRRLLGRKSRGTYAMHRWVLRHSMTTAIATFAFMVLLAWLWWSVRGFGEREQFLDMRHADVKVEEQAIGFWESFVAALPDRALTRVAPPPLGVRPERIEEVRSILKERGRASYEVATVTDGSILRNVYLVGTTSRAAAFLQVKEWGVRSGEECVASGQVPAPEQACVSSERVLIMDRALVVCHAEGEACVEQDGRPSEEAASGKSYFADFAVAFREADLEPACQELPVAESTGLDWQTATLAEEGIAYYPDRNGDVVRNLVRALEPCASVRWPVVVRVEGFASSEPFAGVCQSASEELNVRVANARRAAVEEALSQARKELGLSSQEFLIASVANYGTIREMEAARRFQDRPWVVPTEETNSPIVGKPGGANVREGVTRDGAPWPQDWLTLSARIRVVDVGECKPS